MADLDLLIRGRRVVGPDGIRPAAVGVRGGQIVIIEPYDTHLSAAATAELAADEVLLPGLVDTHVHINEPGRTAWEGFATATRAAAAGGITTLIDMPLNSIPPTVSVDALHAKRAAAAGQCHVDVGFWGGAIPGNSDQRGPLAEAGVFGFKCFTIDSGVPEFPPLDETELERAMRQAAGLGFVLIVHAEDAAVLRAAPPAAGRDYASFLRSGPRPPSSPRSPALSPWPAAPEPALTCCTCRPRTRCLRSPPPGGMAWRSARRRARTTWRWSPRMFRTAVPSSSAARRSASAPMPSNSGRRCGRAPSTAWCPITRRARPR